MIRLARIPCETAGLECVCSADCTIGEMQTIDRTIDRVGL
jgi:hypothetical protein